MRLRTSLSFQDQFVQTPDPTRPHAPLSSRQRAVRALTTILLLALLGLLAYWIYGSLIRYRPLAVAAPIAHPVAFLQDGRLERVEVTEGQHVSVGQALARLSDPELAMRIQEALVAQRRAECDLSAATVQLQAQVVEAEAALARAQASLVTETEQVRLREFELTERHRDKLFSLMVDEEEDYTRALLNDAKMARLTVDTEGALIELDRARSLAKSNALSTQEVDLKRIDYEGRARELAELKVAVKRSHEQHLNATKRRENWEQSVPAIQSKDLLEEARARIREYEVRLTHLRKSPALEVLRMQVQQADLHVKRLQQQQELLLLKAPIAGVVSQLMPREGDPIRAQAPVMTILDPKIRTLDLYIEERYVPLCEAGRVVRLTTMDNQHRFDGTLSDPGPDVVEIPRRFWTTFNTNPIYGRRVQVALPAQTDVLPGTTCYVDF